MDDSEPFLNTISILFNQFNIGLIINLIVVIILLLFSALVSGSEIAYFSLNPSEKELLANNESKSCVKAKQLLSIPQQLLATILVANNFANIGVIIFTTYFINNLIDFSHILPWLTFVIQVVGITFVILLFGEVIPKIYATKNALKLVRLMAFPLFYLKKIFKPFNYLLIHSTSFIDKGIKKKSLDVSIEELSHALDLAEDIPENEDEHKILKSIVKFGETSVKQVMKARVDIIAVNNDVGFAEIIKIILEHGYSRLPVYNKNIDEILGVLYIKDLLPYIKKENNFDWHILIRKPFYVPENKKLDDLLKDFQEKKVHLAIVVDEYGGTAGIITLEDILEEIVGEISDEFDDESIAYSKLDENNYIFDGKTSLNDVCKILAIDDDTFFDDINHEADSLAGLIIEIAGKIPQKNEKVVYKNFNFIIEASDKRRVKRIKLTRNIDKGSSKIKN